MWRPWAEWADEFSLGQVWVTRGTGSQTQTVEVGLQVRKDSFGDWEPHVYVQNSQVIYPRTKIAQPAKLAALSMRWSSKFRRQGAIGG